MRRDVMRHPRSGVEYPRVVLESPDIVEVVAVTDADELVMVRQFRFGTEEVTLEVPAGLVDPGEDPLSCARRELLEETGFVASRWSSLGVMAPNPAFLSARGHLFLAEGATRDREPSPDPGEDLSTELWSRDAVRAAVADGAITNALTLVALARVLDLRARADRG